jgi:gluconolactonase
MNTTLQYEIRDPKFIEVVDVNAGIYQLITNLEFTEGPVWHPKEQSLIFSDIWGNTIYSWNQKDGLVKRRMNSYMANGNAYDLQGRLVTCEHATSRLTRTDWNASIYETLASHYQGKQLNSPNDVVVKSDGTIYFTDPVSGRSEGYGVPREPQLSFNGVYHLDPTTNDLTLLVDDFSKPNGLCFSLNENLLYINDTDRHHIRVFEVQKDGTITNGRIFAEVTGEGTGVPDGMKIDVEGNI